MGANGIIFMYDITRYLTLNNLDSINLILSGETNIKKLIDELYLTDYQGGFVNGGVAQLSRPNAFIVPQGRCAEHLLFSTILFVIMLVQWEY